MIDESNGTIKLPDSTNQTKKRITIKFRFDGH
jgi:hypothetical protein